MIQPPSVDPQEVAYYEKMAALWWDASGPFWPLHRLNTLRTTYIRDFLASHFHPLEAGALPLAGLSILDIGCGGGILSESMARLGAAVHGVDVVARNVEIARLHARQASLAVRYDVESAEALADSGARYDAVLNMEVVEHVADLPGFMSASCRLVRSGGVMFVATINRTLASLLSAKIAGEYVLRWLPRGTHRWGRFRTPAEIEGFLDKGGLRLVAETGVFVNPFNRHFSLTRYLGVNYMLAAEKTSAG